MGVIASSQWTRGDNVMKRRSANLTFRNAALLLLLSALAACSLHDDEEAARVRVSVNGNAALVRRAFTVTIGGIGWSRKITGADLGAPDLPNYTPPFPTPTSGTLQVDVVLRDSTGGHFTHTSIVLDLRPDWIWEVDLVVGRVNPFETCFGCSGTKSCALDSVYQEVPGDSLYIVWGGTSISHPVVY